MKRIRKLAILPTMFTLGNLVCGFFAIVIAARVDKPGDVPHTIEFVARQDVFNCMLAGWLIILAMIFDALDGHVARLTRTSSDFGAELDSLCDMVTFGVAPAFLLVKLCPKFTYLHNEAVWIIAATFAVCAALRLARFNVESGEDDDHMNFSGLPSPAAASTVAGFAILFHSLLRENSTFNYAEQVYQFLQTVLPFFTLCVAVLMVSRVRYPHLVNQFFRGHKSFNHLVAVVFTVVAVMLVRGYSLAIVSTAFALSGPARYVWREIQQRTTREEPLY
ncbi:MAG: CDP-diacylglycerol--serine O-phosphatidyltransferase [Pirellulales bacterium]